LAEQIEQKIPELQRKEVKLSECKKHGDPRQVTPENAAWLELYEMIAPYHLMNGDQLLLNIEILRAFCHEAALSFFEVYQKMSLIHKELYDQH
jgi:hypothetical protein